MNQCRSCASFNDEGAAFCGQCGSRLQERRGPLPGRRVRRKLLLAVLGLALGLGGVKVAEIALGPAAKEVAAPRAGPLPRRGRSMEAPPRPPERPRPEEVRRLAAGALATLDLLDEGGARLRSIRGVLLSSAGNVLCRFRPLLGAYGAELRGGGEAAGREVLGLIAYDPHRDLALLEAVEGRNLSGLPAGQETGMVITRGMEVWVFSPGALARTYVAEVPYFTGDGVPRARLAEEPPLPAAAVLALDEYGGWVGLCAAEPIDGEEEPEARRILLDLLGPLEQALGRPAVLTLAEATARFYQGGFQDLLDRGRKALEAENVPLAVDLLNGALDQGQSEGRGREDLQEALGLLQRALESELERLRRTKDWRGAVRYLMVAAARFPGERRYWAELGGAHLELEEHREAVNALLEARRLEPGGNLDSLLLRSYLEASRKELNAGRLALAAEWLERGAHVLPDSARLYLELAKLYQRWGLYDDAAARRLDPGLGPEVEAALERIEDLVRRREAVILEIPPGASTIQTEVVLNGTAAFRFIIDTGATYTSISQHMADVLGYQITATTERVVIGTANGIIMAPVVMLESVNLRGYAVRNVKAVVLPERAQTQLGLLGLNFLEHFRYSMDPGRREFRLEKR
jgi:clan AA aspartic protease (TIGR02281 family)